MSAARTTPGPRLRRRLVADRNAECVAAAEADASCATPLVLNIGWDACYCATDACDAPCRYELHDDVPLRWGQSRPRAARQRYENFTWESPCRPSRAPTLSPTSTPTTPPTVRGALSSSSSSSEGKPGTVAVVLMVILCFLFWQGGEVHYGCSNFTICAKNARVTQPPRRGKRGIHRRHPVDMAAVTATVKSSWAASVVVRERSFDRAPRGDTDWSCHDEAVGKVLRAVRLQKEKWAWSRESMWFASRFKSPRYWPVRLWNFEEGV